MNSYLVNKALSFGSKLLNSINSASSINKSISDDIQQKEGGGFSDDAIEPEYDPKTYKSVAVESAILMPSINAMVNGVVGQGFNIFPLMDVDNNEFNNQIKIMIYQVAVYFRKNNKTTDKDSLFQQLNLPTNIEKIDDVSDELVDTIKEFYKEITYSDQVLAEAFFSQCCKKYSYLDLLNYTHRDIQKVGYGVWEIERSSTTNEIKYINYLPCENVRVTAVGTEKVEVDIKRRINPLIVDSEIEYRSFRKVIVDIDGQKYWAKEFGDPRAISQKTGKFYDDLKSLQNDDGLEAQSGGEVVLFTNDWGAYGNPQWVAALPQILGAREASEYNYKNFKDGFMARMAVIVKNSILGTSARKEFEEYLMRSKGTSAQHKMLVLETTSDGDGKQEGVEFKDLSKSFQSDSFFGEYEKTSEEAVAAQYNLSKIARGKSTDYNRATAYASREHDETMVYSSVRRRWDEWITNTFLLELGINSVKYESNMVPTTDEQEASKNITTDVEKGVITINEARNLKEKNYQTNFVTIDEPWANQPMPVTLAGYNSEGGLTEDLETEDDGVFLENELEEKLKIENAKILADEAKILAEQNNE